MLRTFLITLFLSLAIQASPLDELETQFNGLKSQPVSDLGYQKVTNLWKEITLLNAGPWEKEELRSWENRRNALLLKTGKLRFSVIEAGNFEGGFREYVEDSLFELQIIPKRWLTIFELKYTEISNKLNNGRTQLGTLLPEILGLFLFILLPFFVIKTNNYLINTVESLRDSFSNPYKLNSSRQNVAILLQRLGPFIPLVLTVIALKLFSSVVTKTVFSEFALLIPFILYYLYYKIFRQLVINFLILFSEYVKVGKSREAKLKIYSTTKVLGRFFFIALISLHSVSSVAGKGLLYKEMNVLFWILGTLHYLWIVKSWSKEIDDYAARLFTGVILKSYQKITALALLSFVVRTFTFILILFHPVYLEIKERVLDLGVGKSIIAKLFQHQLESNEKLVEQANTKLPEDYAKWFGSEKDEDENLWVHSKNQRLEEIEFELDEWLNDTSEEHSLAIYGDKGIGKTQVLRHLETYLLDHKKKPEVVIANVPPKISSKSEILKFLGKIVAGKELHDAFELLDIDREIGKKVIILDDAHNLFLTHFGGLKGIEAFFEALNVRTENIFWVASFNTYSWIYLDQVFYKNKYFRTVFKIKGFSDEELQEYILRRHERSGYSLSYADIIRAVKTKNTNNEVAYVENMFFRLLWEQSQGNPELAEKLWLKALKPLYGKRLKVGLPLNKNYSILHKLADDALFVFSALVRHENLTTNEIIRVTDMKEGVVRHSLRIGLENEFLVRNEIDKRYRFSVEGQYSVLSLLKAKNFIYE